MTDRVCGFMVVLERDMREDDAAEIKSAIEHVRGVMAVDEIEGGANVATTRAVLEITRELMDYLRRRRATPRAIFEDASMVSPGDE